MNNIKKLYAKYKQNRKVLDIKIIEDDDKNTIHKPSNICIIIPHRNRIDHLKKFISHINKLDKGNNTFTIIIVDQNNADLFNRALLLNIGYYIAKINNNYDRYIFHDVDSYPTQELFNMYFTHLDYNIHYASPYLEYKYSYYTFIGGVIGLKGSDIERTNGYSNFFYGHSGEDDSQHNRLKICNIKLYRPSKGSYILEEHDPPNKNEINQNKMKNILDDLKTWKQHGLNELNYKFINYKEFELDDFIKNYEKKETNFSNGADLLINYKKTNNNQIKVIKIDYVALHFKEENELL